jgi:hypothetical protein
MKKQILIQAQTGMKSALIRHRRQPINQRRQRIIRKMIQKLTDGIDPLSTGRTPCHNNAAPIVASDSSA